MINIDLNWAVVQTKPATEEIAERSIREAGYRVYLPRYRKIMRGHRAEGHGKVVLCPLFTGYLFVEHHEDHDGMLTRAGAMRDTLLPNSDGSLSFGRECAPPLAGVERVLRYRAVDGTRGALKLVSTELVEMVREAENAGEFDEARDPGKRGKRTDIKPGDDVRIESGPFAAFAAKLVGLDDQGGARLVFSLFGRENLATVDADTLSLMSA